jgi:hypothetical protein
MKDAITDEEYFSIYDLGCAMLVLGLVIAAIDIGIVVFWVIMG